MAYTRNSSIGRQIIDFFPERINFLFVVLLLAALPVTYYLAVNQTQYQQKAANNSGDIIVDFGSRQNNAFPISQAFLGVGGLGLQNVIHIAPQYVSQANLRLTKIDTNFQNIFQTQASVSDVSSQNWTELDNYLNFFQENKMVPILVLDYTPVWLQPQNQNPSVPNPCLQIGKPTEHVKPTYIVNGQDSGPQMFGQLAAQLVSHIDRKFPQLHAYYELWNEPSASGYWCEPSNDPNPDADRLSEWKQLYAATAPQIKQQAQKDGQQSKVGGPALSFSQGNAAIWVPSIVNDPTVAPYLDFVSYHHYEEGSSTWPDLVSVTQGVTTRGNIYLYQDIASYVRNGKQPNAQQTPIIIDEYNANPCSPGQCRNDKTYAPLWSALFLTDMLDAVVTPVSPNGVARNVISGMSYASWSNPTAQSCLFGVIDPLMDCSILGSLAPYPQYYTYQLFGGSNYLNIEDNGYVANNVLSNPVGVYATGFYTNHLDNVVVVNTTGNDYPELSVFSKNPGYQLSGQANVYTLSSKNDFKTPIKTQQVTLGLTQGGVLSAIHVPAYAVVALSFQASSLALTPTPTPTPTNTPDRVFLSPSTLVQPQPPTSVPSQSGELVIYSTHMENGFRDNSFGYSSVNSCDKSSFIIPPCSYSIAYTEWGAIDFVAPAKNIDTSSYKSINWYLNPNGLPLTDFSILYTGPGINNEFQLGPSNIVNTLPAGWYEVSVPMSLVNPKSRPLDTLQLKNWQNTSFPIIYVQNVRFVQ